MFCRICSLVYPNCLIDEYSLFDEIIIDDRFSDKFKALFLLKYYMYLDIVFPHYKYIDSNKSKCFGCMHHESRTSSRQVFITFLNVLFRVCINNVVLIYNELESHPEISFKQLHFFQERGNRFHYDLMISFYSCVNVETFENIYKNFVSVKDYDSRCFKIVNEHYLKYLDAKEQCYLKYRKEENFDLVFLRLNKTSVRLNLA